MDSDADLIPTRASLLSRLRDLDDQGSWRHFFDMYWRLIFNFARKSGFSETEAQDIVQETFVRVARHIPEFHYNPKIGSFKGWLMQITRSRIYDALRRKHAKVQDRFMPREETLKTDLIDSKESDQALEAVWDVEWKDHLLHTALERIKADTETRQFQIFHLHVVKGVEARQVARRLGAKLPEVYFAKYKLSGRLKKELKRVEQESLSHGNLPVQRIGP